MIGLIVATHGDLVFGLKDTYEMVAGKVDENVVFMSLSQGSNVDIFRADFKNNLEKFSNEDGVLILVDLEGGTPYNIASEFFFNEELGNKIEVIAGVNFPMLIDAALGLNTNNISKFADEIREIGIESIKKLSRVSISNNITDDEF